MIYEDLSAVVFFKNLPISGFLNTQVYKSESFALGGTNWFINWYPFGNKKEFDGTFSIFLAQEKEMAMKVGISFELLNYGKSIWKEKGPREYVVGTESCGYASIMKTNELRDGCISLRVKISIKKPQLPECRFERTKKIVESLEKDIVVVAGESSTQINSSILRSCSPVFQAMLSSKHNFLESRKKNIDLGVSYNKMLLKDFTDFLAGKAIHLKVREEEDLARLKALITFGDKYQIESLLEHILFIITNKPTNFDILERLTLISSYKHISMVKKKWDVMISWAYIRLSKAEFLQMTTKLIMSDSEFED